MKYLIYKHTLIAECPHKGWSYIGQTCRAEDPNLRWQNGKGYSKNKKFYNAIKKHGWENFSHEILAEVNTPQEADDLEIKYIKEYDTIKNGYNITPGGAGRHLYKPILQLDENKTILARFNSVSEAELELNLPFRHSNITSCCNGKQRKSHGYFWCYEEDYFDYKIKEKKPRSKSSKSGNTVYQLDEFKNIIAEYSSYLAAQRAVSKNEKCKSNEAIKACCLGKRISYYGFYWCLASNYTRFKILGKAKRHSKKQVLKLDVLTLEVLEAYSSVAEATRACGGASGCPSIISCCQGKQKTAYGFRWKYKED